MRRRSPKLLVALLVAVSLLAGACGGGDEDSSGTTAGDSKSKKGGELVDLGTFVGDPPEHIDPALNTVLDSYQVVNALYDGLTEIDSTDPDNPEVKPLVAESFESNDDATVWTFKIKEGQKFSNGEAVLPSSFVRAWERASNKDFAGDYSYLFNFIKGGKEKLDGTADKLAGVTADDQAMTLVVEMEKPYANFDVVAGFQLFFPMPKAVEALSDQSEWENGLMIGNGPYKLEKPRSDQEIVVVKNPEWGGDIFGNKEPNLDKITFRVSKDPDSAYNALEAGEGDTANIAPGKVKQAQADHGTTLDVRILGSYHYLIDMDDPLVGGAKNKLFRQAISQAIDREEINQAVYDGSRTTSTGITPPGIPGFEEDICKYCSYDLDAAKKALADWKAAGNSQTAPIKIQFNADAGHEPVVSIVVDNLKAIGIEAVSEPMPTETYFTSLADGACQICRSGWYADYPTYDNFMYDLFHQDAVGGNNSGPYKSDAFDKLVDEAKSETDKDKQAELFQQAEDVLLNTDIGVIPLNWYRGDYVYDNDKIAKFPQTNMGLVLWEQVALKA